MRLIIAARTIAQTRNAERFRKIALQRLAAVFLVLCLLWLGACSQQPPEASPTPATEVALVDEEAVAPAPTEAALPEPPAAESEDVDECLRCHADKEMLITTASPEEVVISENEGEG